MPSGKADKADEIVECNGLADDGRAPLYLGVGVNGERTPEDAFVAERLSDAKLAVVSDGSLPW